MIFESTSKTYGTTSAGEVLSPKLETTFGNTSPWRRFNKCNRRMNNWKLKFQNTVIEIKIFSGIINKLKRIDTLEDWLIANIKRIWINTNNGIGGISSVAQSCPTLCDPMNHSMPGLPVHHQLPESTETHVHWVGDANQPSHPLSSLSPPALNLSQHQGLFQWVSSSHQVARVFHEERIGRMLYPVYKRLFKEKFPE